MEGSQSRSALPPRREDFGFDFDLDFGFCAPAEMFPPRYHGLLTVSKEWNKRVRGRAERLAR